MGGGQAARAPLRAEDGRHAAVTDAGSHTREALTDLVTGGSGLVGRHLIARLDGPRLTSRSPDRARAALGAVDVAAWPVSPDTFAGVDAVFHLVGEPVAQRWTGAARRRMYDSRVGGTRALVDAIAASGHRPRVLVSASAVGYYGDRGDEVLGEDAGPGTDFLADLCQAWEAQAGRATALGVRVVCLRLGIVLANDGGALARMLGPFRLGLGGRLGDGRQWMPWVGIDDLVGLLLHAAATDGLSGPVNAASPNPVRNADFTRALGAALGRSTPLPVPRLALRAAFGGFADAMLASQRVAPRRALETGYVFRHAEIADALQVSVGR